MFVVFGNVYTTHILSFLSLEILQFPGLQMNTTILCFMMRMCTWIYVQSLSYLWCSKYIFCIAVIIIIIISSKSGILSH